MRITSPQFDQMQGMPRDLTQQGKNLSPELHFAEVPQGTVSLVLICEDPDAPDPAAPLMTFSHWVLYNLPKDTSVLGEGVVSFPEGAEVGLNGRGEPGYIGPRPPVGCHRYFFKLFALDVRLNLKGPVGRDDVLTAIQGHVIEQAELIGTYQLQA